MKRTDTILKRLPNSINKLEHELVKLLITLKTLGYYDIVDKVFTQLSNSFTTIAQQELLEFKDNYDMQLESNVEPNYDKNLNIYLNSIYDYNYDFYLTDYNDSIKTIETILDKQIEFYYLESNVYTLLAAFIRMKILDKLIQLVTEFQQDEYTKAFQFSKYKTFILKTIDNLQQSLHTN